MKIMLIFIRLHTKINTASTNTYTTPTTKNTNFHHRQGQKFKAYTHASTLSNTSTRMETQTSTYINHIHTKLYCNGSAQKISPSVFKCENKLWCCSRVFPKYMLFPAQSIYTPSGNHTCCEGSQSWLGAKPFLKTIPALKEQAFAAKGAWSISAEHICRAL